MRLSSVADRPTCQLWDHSKVQGHQSLLLAKGKAAQLLSHSPVPPATGTEQVGNEFTKKLKGEIGRWNKHSCPEE